jgi:hypothetical protein
MIAVIRYFSNQVSISNKSNSGKPVLEREGSEKLLAISTKKQDHILGD